VLFKTNFQSIHTIFKRKQTQIDPHHYPHIKYTHSLFFWFIYSRLNNKNDDNNMYRPHRTKSALPQHATQLTQEPERDSEMQDTFVSFHSFDAARLAAGAVCFGTHSTKQ
jgi:hypothetical protein